MILSPNSLIPSCLPVDADLNDGAEPELIINHLNQNHYSPDSNSNPEVDHPSGPADLQENHTSADPQLLRHKDEEENGVPGSCEPPGGEGGVEIVLMEDQTTRFLSPAALKKHIHGETTKVNNELRVLITKEIRKPGRRTYMWGIRTGCSGMQKWWPTESKHIIKKV